MGGGVFFDCWERPLSPDVPAEVPADWELCWRVMGRFEVADAVDLLEGWFPARLAAAKAS